MFAPVAIVEAGNMIPGLGPVATFALSDPVNAAGQIAFEATTQGPVSVSGIVRVSGQDPVSQAVAPWGPMPYASTELQAYIARLTTQDSSDPDLAALTSILNAGTYSIQAKGCLLTAVSMALQQLNLGEVSPGVLFQGLEAAGGISANQMCQWLECRSDTVASFEGASLSWGILGSLFPGLQSTAYGDPQPISRRN